jgi:hypothetical protein
MIPLQLNTAARAQTAPSGCASKYQQFLLTRMKGMEEDVTGREGLYTLLYSDISIRHQNKIHSLCGLLHGVRHCRRGSGPL